MRIGFDFDFIEAAISPENDAYTEAQRLLTLMQQRNVVGIITDNVMERMSKKFSAGQLTIAEALLAEHNAKQIDTSDKSDMLAEDYLMYGVIHRRNKRNARNIAVYAMNNVFLYVTMNFSDLGRYTSRQTIGELNQKRNVSSIDLGSPTHARHVLQQPDFVSVIHQAQTEVYTEHTPTSVDEEKIKAIRRSRKTKILWLV